MTTPSFFSRRISLPAFALHAVLGAASIAVLLCGCRQTATSTMSRAVRFTYTATVTNVPPEAESVTAWIPLPVEHRYQRVEELDIRTEFPYDIVHDKRFSNRMVRVDFSDAANATQRTAVIAFHVTRDAYDVLEGDPPPALAPHLEPGDFLQATKMVPTGGTIAEEAQTVTGGTTNPLNRARQLYDHIVSSVTYDKTGEGWGRGDAVYACSVRKGNCTDFHSLLIGESRSLKQPARFIIGVPLPPGADEGTVGGYHCWAELYVEGKGWLPVDASEASKHPEKKEGFFGGLDANRIGFTLGRDIPLPGAETEPLNYFIYPHVEVDGARHQDVGFSFEFSDR